MRLGILIGHPLIRRHAVMMSSLNHERAREHQVRQLGVAESAAHVEVRPLPFIGEHEAVPVIG